MDVEQLLRPVDADSPCGPDLEYDPDFLALEQAATSKAEREIGDTLVAAQPPDWKQVARLAPALLARTKDLRAALALTQAQTALHGISGLADGLELIDGLVRSYWDGVYPLLDADDDNDPTMRMNALAPLADASGLLRTIRNSELFNVRGFGPVSVRQVEVALGMLPAKDDESALTLEQVQSMLASAREAGTVANVSRALRAAESLAAWLDLQVGADRATDLRPLITRLRPIADLVGREEQPADTTPADDHEPGMPSMAAAAAAAAAAVASIASHPMTSASIVPLTVAAPGELRSRDDARRMLERVCEFLERTEPSNPAPLLVRRAIRLMSMSFMDIVRDLAPESIATVENIAGAARSESSTESDDES